MERSKCAPDLARDIECSFDTHGTLLVELVGDSIVGQGFRDYGEAVLDAAGVEYMEQAWMFQAGKRAELGLEPWGLNAFAGNYSNGHGTTQREVGARPGIHA